MNSIQRFASGLLVRFLALASVLLVMGAGCAPAQKMAPDRTPIAGALPTSNFSLYFGDGSDGDVTCSGSVALTRDTYYHTLAIAPGCALNTQGWRVFVSLVLDLTSAPTGAIFSNGPDGGDASGINAGASATLLPSPRSWQGALSPQAGKAGGTTTGTAGGTTGSASFVIAGGMCGSGGGAGGTGSSGAGGAVGAVTTPAGTNSGLRYPTVQASPSGLTPIHGYNSPSGGSGGGDGTAGGGSGGGASGGGGVGIFARNVLRSSTNTNTGIISAKGGRGGNGGVPAGGNRGGGGGAPGAGGGSVYILAGALKGSPQANAIDVSGGKGGDGGAGTGTGTTGLGAQAGFGGTVSVVTLGIATEMTIDTSGSGAISFTDLTAIGGASNVGATGGASTPALASL